jgi:hypothetical protein
LCALALIVSVVAPRDGLAQAEPSSADENATADTGFGEVEEIIVRGRSWGELRFEIRRFEEAVFARFNEINSTDDFDIKCRSEKVRGLLQRYCQSNFARDLQGKAATAAVRLMQGAPGGGLGQLYAQEARRLQGLLDAEMRQLAAEDEQLAEAIAELSRAEFALTLARGKRTLSRQVTAASGSLPHGAALMFEIIMGVHPFRHALTRQTFTIADVLGEISKLTVDCAEGRQRIDYESGVEWTVPDDWSACTLQVNAEQETKFRLYEF